MENESQVLTAKSLIGNHVKSDKGEDLGKIAELMIDQDTGQIVAAVLSCESERCRGEFSTIPWGAMTLSPVDGHIYIDSDILDQLPEPDGLLTRIGEPEPVTSVLVYTSSIYRSSGELNLSGP